jgi:hypothetical protein
VSPGWSGSLLSPDGRGIELAEWLEPPIKWLEVFWYVEKGLFFAIDSEIFSIYSR